MNKALCNRHSVSDGLGKLSIVVWIAILVFNGVYFRNRLLDIEPTIDWVIITQLLACTLGGVLGIVLMQRHCRYGFGTKTFLIYLSVVAFSAVQSPYSATVIGYWILYAGAGLLTIGLVQQAQTLKDLVKLEKTWLIITILILIVNTITSFVNVSLHPQYGNVSRLGMGWVHASVLGYLSSYVFCVSFMKEELRRPILLWILRLFLLFIVVVSRTRVPLLICALSLAMQVGRLQRKKMHPWILISCFFVVVLTIGALAVSFDIPGATDSFDWFNRGNVSSLKTFTGRTEIWLSAVRMVTEDSLRILLGYGYGISRLVLNEGPAAPSYYADHCHNDFLEHLFSIGIVGLIPYGVLLAYSAKWITGFQQRCREFSPGFAVRAATIMVAFYLDTILNIPLGGKVAPHTILVIFYILTLDKSRHLKTGM